MALFNECRERHAHIALDIADIVREAIFHQSTANRASSLVLMLSEPHDYETGQSMKELETRRGCGMAAA